MVEMETERDGLKTQLELLRTAMGGANLRMAAFEANYDRVCSRLREEKPDYECPTVQTLEEFKARYIAGKYPTNDFHMFLIPFAMCGRHAKLWIRPCISAVDCRSEPISIKR